MRKVRKIFPLFSWYYCCNCVSKFKWMVGWKKTVGPYYGGVGKTQYLCSDCAPTRVDACLFFIHIGNITKDELDPPLDEDSELRSIRTLADPPIKEPPTRPTL